MRGRVLHLGWGLGVLLACGGDARTTLLPPPGVSAGAAGAAGVAGRSGAGGAAPAPTDAGVDGAPASGGGAGGLTDASRVDEPDGSTDPGGPILVSIDPESIVIFDLPITSTRFAAAGFDAATGICASIIWDYSNNDLEIARHCDDFGTYPDFHYVLVREPPESCDNLQGFWDYSGLEPASVSGCFDPAAGSVNVQLEVFTVPTFYRIIMNNEP